MKKRGIRNLALTLALTNLLSLGSIKVAKADHGLYYIITKDGKLEAHDDIRAVYNKGRTFVEDDEKISIYDDDNTISRQFGGNQAVFIDSFDSLIKNPYIWEEMQKCFPVSDFPSKACAMDFYELYFNTLAKSGCGYISIVNRIFQEFEGREEEFEEIFGFPMYEIDSDNAIDFNYEILTLKFFNYAALYPDYSEERKKQIENMYAKTIAGKEFNRYTRSDEYNMEKKDWRQLEGEEQLEYLIWYIEKDEKYDELYEKWQKAENKTISLSMRLDNDFGHVKDFLKGYGIDCNPTTEVLYSDFDGYEPGDIVVSYIFDLYKEDNGEKYSRRDDLDSHAVNVVSNENGKVMVSSWGQKFVFDYTDAYWTMTINLNLAINNKIKTR